MVVVVMSRAMGPTVGVAMVVVVAIIMRSLAAVTSTAVLEIWTLVVDQVSLSGEGSTAPWTKGRL